jgi:transcriptional regulator with XRE-family HTH domain
MNIGNKISQLRRDKGVTQEQLAGFTGVSVAAVSKWETDNSYPDITLLPLIAEFFEVSIDALLDYDLTNEKLKMLKDSNNRYVKSGDYEAGIPLYEEAIVKYPNDFDIVYHYGNLLFSKALSSDPADCEIALKAVKYLEKAILLHPGYGIDINNIRQVIAYIYGGIGEYDKAINILQIYSWH